MPNALPTSLLARLARFGRGSRRLPDPAEMGTAFGLECFLDERRDQDGGAPLLPAPASSPGWLDRWMRQKPSR